MAELLTNAWYMAGWQEEVSEAPLSRRMLGMSMVLYRKADGGVVMLRDRCPHRFAPLSKGKVEGDCIQCPYHGLKFDASGQCVSAPLEEKPPSAVRVRSFPVVERDNIIWFWPGDPEAADPALITDDLAEALDLAVPLFSVLHSNHARELTPAVRAAYLGTEH